MPWVFPRFYEFPPIWKKLKDAVTNTYSIMSNVGHQSIVKVHTKYKVGNVIFPIRRSNYS